jgi:hypothetical protein
MPGRRGAQFGNRRLSLLNYTGSAVECRREWSDGADKTVTYTGIHLQCQAPVWLKELHEMPVDTNLKYRNGV